MTFLLKIMLFLSLSSSVFAMDTIVFAPLPMKDKKTIYNNFYPMLKYLEKNLHKKIIFDYSEDYAQIIEKFKQGKIDLAYLGPLPYVQLKEDYPKAIPLVHFRERSGNTFYTCALVTALTSEHKIHTVALTQPLSTCGYLSTNTLLDNKLLNHQYRYLGRHDLVAIEVLKGHFEFGGLKTNIAKEYEHLGLEILSTTEPLPTFALVGNSKKLSNELLNEITKILIEAKSDEISLWGDNIKYGALKAKNEDYDSLRKMKNNISIPKVGNF